MLVGHSRLTDVNGGEAGQPPELLSKVLKKHAGVELPLTGQLAELIKDAATTDTSKREDPGQKLLDGRMYEQAPGQEPPAGDKKGAEAGDGAKDLGNIAGEELPGMYRRLERTGLSTGMRGDGGYDARKIFALPAALGVIPITKARINSAAGTGDEHRARSTAAIEQPEGKGGCTDRDLNRMTRNERPANRKDWKEGARHGLRWMAEIAVSAFKGIFGGSIRAPAPGTAYTEIATKAAACNQNPDTGDGAMRRMGDPYEAAMPPSGQRRIWGAVA